MWAGASKARCRVRSASTNLARRCLAGQQSHEIYVPLVRQAERLLVRGRMLVVELGYNALDHARLLFDAPAWANVGVTNDLGGIPRVIAAARVSVA